MYDDDDDDKQRHRALNKRFCSNCVLPNTKWSISRQSTRAETNPPKKTAILWSSSEISSKRSAEGQNLNYN